MANFLSNFFGKIFGNKHEKDVSNLKPGFYFVRLTTNEKQKIHKIIKK